VGHALAQFGSSERYKGCNNNSWSFTWEAMDNIAKAVPSAPLAAAGGEDEFIFSGRLDNLCMSWCALQALADTCASADDLAGWWAVLPERWQERELLCAGV
jgi:hypothetical protein